MAEATVMNHGNMNQLRAILWEQIEGIRTGKVTPAQANATSNLSGKFLNTIKLEIDYHKLSGKTPTIAAMLEESSQQ